MPEATQRRIEVEARRILRDRIKRMPWHTGLPPEERKRLIEADVERWWFLGMKTMRLTWTAVPSPPPGLPYGDE
jgi:hypothetical protein